MKNQEKESAKRDFLSEAEELLEELTADIQTLEALNKKGQMRPELVNKVFREFHSLKGISGMLGFDRISSFTHELETLLDRMRLGKTPLNSKTIDLLYQALDMLTRLIGEISQDSDEKTDLTPVLTAVKHAIQED